MRKKMFIFGCVFLFTLIAISVGPAHAGKKIIDRLKDIPSCREIQTSYAPENIAAARLYESLGFEQTGDEIDGETIGRRVSPEV